jgi:dTDP-4-amino-4,6-dideoxygalactose transaminase
VASPSAAGPAAVLQFPLIRPDVPSIGEWAPILQEAYEGRRFSNFGPLSRRLEQLLAETWGGPETVCVATSSGTAALAAALIAGGVSGRVVLPAFTFPATLSAVRMAGCEPWLVDVDPADWRISAGQLARSLEAAGAAAAILLCPFGLASDFRPHVEVAAMHGARLVIDNAAGLGVARQTLESVTPGYCEACSLHVTKPFGIGEGGLVFAHRSQEDALRRAINFGLTAGSADLQGWGINGKLSELHAAVGLAAAAGFAGRLARRREVVARYAAVLAGIEGVAACTQPASGSWQFFPLLLPSAAAADRFVAAAAERGMESRRYYAPALSRLPGVDRLGPCPVAEDLARRMCCIPVYSDATDAEVDSLVVIFEHALAAAVPGTAAVEKHR